MTIELWKTTDNRVAKPAFIRLVLDSDSERHKLCRFEFLAVFFSSWGSLRVLPVYLIKDNIGNMPPKRSRKAAEDAKTKTSLEESASALAGVEGALKTTKTAGGKRKAASGTTASKKPKKSAARKERANSLEELTEVAGALLKGEDDLSSVPNPMSTTAVAAAAAAAAAVPMPALPPIKNGGDQPTGFRKKPAAPKASAGTASKSKAAAAKGGGDGKKNQIQYNPDVPMSKEELTAWRREMRRVRNRESAAASRRKVRDRIEELEDEVKTWKERYAEVMVKLSEAESKKKKGTKEEEANV